MMLSESHTQAIIRYQHQCIKANVRAFYVIKGDVGWCYEMTEALLMVLPVSERLWFAEEAGRNITAFSFKQAKELLGTESDCVIFDAHSGFDADAFGIAAGIVKGGGAFLLQVPFRQYWESNPQCYARRLLMHPYEAPEISHRFIDRFTKLLNRSAEVVMCQQDANDIEFPVLNADLYRHKESSDYPYATEDQKSVVEAIFRVVRGHRRRPLVISADRGRGKSSALGIAAAQLINEGLKHVVITAPSPTSVQAVFQWAQELIPGGERHGNRFIVNKACLEFVAPDELYLSSCKADLIMVDEAAAIPTGLLTRFVQRYSRLVFSTTIYGYEGNGRGFELRFFPVLNQLVPEWKSIKLHEPVRWQDGDPLEKFVFASLLLKPKVTYISELENIPLDEVHCTEIDREKLAENEEQLAHIFSLLVQAHYRTKPNDLWQLLDGPNIELYVTLHKNRILAVALLAREGEIDKKLAREIYLGRRRARGHLLAQSLAMHVGYKDAAQFRFRRIIRIAVQPELRRKGLAHQLLRHIESTAQVQGTDLLGASFGASPNLVRFWTQCGYLPARLGFERESSSGTHSLMVLKPMSKSGQKILNYAYERFSAAFPHLLSQQFRVLDTELVLTIFSQLDSLNLEINVFELADVRSYASGHRSLDDNFIALFKFVCLMLYRKGAELPLEMADCTLMVTRILQRINWQEAAQKAGVSGRRAADTKLREIIHRLLVLH